MDEIIKRMSGKELVRHVASEEGYCHTNMWYRDYIAHKYNRHVSPSTISKSLGSYKNRNERNLAYVKGKAKQYLIDVANDLNLATWAVKDVYDNELYI